VNGGTVKTLSRTDFLLAGPTETHIIATDGINVYWTDNGGLKKVTAIDGAGTNSTPMCFQQ